MPANTEAGKLLEEWRTTILLKSVSAMALAMKEYEETQKKVDPKITFDRPDYNRLNNVIIKGIVMRQTELDFIRLVFAMDDSWYSRLSDAVKQDNAQKIQNAKKKKDDEVAPPKQAVETHVGNVLKALRESLGYTPTQFVDRFELRPRGWSERKVIATEEEGANFFQTDLLSLKAAGALTEETYQEFTEAMKADKAAKWEKKAEEEPKVEPEGKEQLRVEPKGEIVVPPIKKVDPPIKEPETVEPPKTKNKYALAVILGIGALLVIVVLIISINNQPPIMAVPTATKEVGTPPAYATELHRQINEAATACVSQGKVFINRDDREFQCVTPTP